MNHTIEVMIHPGMGRDQLDVRTDESLQEVVQRLGLSQYQITINGQKVDPTSYSSILMGTVRDLWAAMPVKGA